MPPQMGCLTPLSHRSPHKASALPVYLSFLGESSQSLVLTHALAIGLKTMMITHPGHMCFCKCLVSVCSLHGASELSPPSRPPPPISGPGALLALPAACPAAPPAGAGHCRPSVSHPQLHPSDFSLGFP